MTNWWFWSLSLLFSGLSLWGFHHLHQNRPLDLLQITEAQFIPYLQQERLEIPNWNNARSRKLPHDWRDETGHFDRAWYRFRLDLEVAPNRLWGLYLPGVEMTPIVYVNGTPVSEEQLFSDPLPRYWNRPAYFTLPNGLLGPGPNEITVHLAANDQWGRITEIYLGPHAELFDHYSVRQSLRTGVMQVNVFICFGLACFVFSLWCVRKDRQFLSFSILVLVWGLQNYVMATEKPWFPNVYWDLTIYTLIGLLTAAASIFGAEFSNATDARWNRVIVVTALLGPMGLLLVAGFDVVAFNLLGSALWIGLLLLFALRPTLLVFRNMIFSPTLANGVLVMAFMLALPLAAKDWLVTAGFGWRHDGFMFQFAAAPIVIAFGVILLNRFASALRESEDLNATLSQRVEAQVAQVDAAHARTRALESEQVLNRERERIMRDMHDGLGGHLIGTLAQLDPSRPRDAGIVQDLELALTDMRLMLDSMDHEMSDIADVVAVFRNRVEHRLTAADINTTWRIAQLPNMKLDADRKLHLLRILQEAVTNTLKHANADEFQFNICEQVGKLEILVADNGCGVGPQSSHGRGMTNIRHRAEVAGFHLQLGHPTEYPSGTQIKLTIPRETEITPMPGNHSDTAEGYRTNLPY